MIDGEIMQVEPENLVTEVLMLKHRDYRIIQICAAKAGDRAREPIDRALRVASSEGAVSVT